MHEAVGDKRNPGGSRGPRI